MEERLQQISFNAVVSTTKGETQMHRTSFYGERITLAEFEGASWEAKARRQKVSGVGVFCIRNGRFRAIATPPQRIRKIIRSLVFQDKPWESHLYPCHQPEIPFDGVSRCRVAFCTQRDTNSHHNFQSTLQPYISTVKRSRTLKRWQNVFAMIFERLPKR
jgi:hypothetical protein